MPSLFFPGQQYYLINSMNKLVNSLAQLNRFKLVFLFVVVSLLTEKALTELVFFVEPEFQSSLTDLSNEMLNQKHSAVAIILYVIIGPYLETLIFQYLLLLNVRRLTMWITKSNSWHLSLFITSLVFASIHSLNIGLNFHGFLNAALLTVTAFSLTLLAVIEFEKKNGHPIVVVTLLHSFYNLLWLIPLIMH